MVMVIIVVMEYP